MNESMITALFTLIGVILGGIMSAYVSSSTTKKIIKAESLKQRVTLLSQRKEKLEKELNQIYYNDTGCNNRNDFQRSYNILSRNSHYFDQSTLKIIIKEYQNILYTTSEDNITKVINGDYSSTLPNDKSFIIQCDEFINKIREIFSIEIRNVIEDINKNLSD